MMIFRTKTLTILFLLSTNALLAYEDSIKGLYIHPDVNVHKLKNKGGDSTSLYGVTLLTEKYKLVIKSKLLVKASRINPVIRKGRVIYNIHVYKDKSNVLRDSLINDVENYLNKKSDLLTSYRNVYIDNGDIYIYVSPQNNSAGEYFLYWYNGYLYKVEYIKSKTLFRRNIGGFGKLDLTLKNDKGVIIDFSELDIKGKEAMEIIKNMNE